MDVAGRKVTAYSVALLGAILIGALLRLYHLGTQSIWWDEAFSVWISQLSLSQIVQRTAVDVHPPLYYFILHYWIAVFGSSEIAVRSLSALFGVLAIPAIYLVGRQLFDKEAGLVGALILALSALNIWYSQEARMYSLMVLLALLSMYFFIRFVQGGTVTTSVGYVASTTLLVYTHNYGWFVVVAQNIYLLTLFVSSRDHVSRLRPRHWALLQALLVTLYVPWIPFLGLQLSHASAELSHIAPPTLRTVFNVFIGYAGMDVLFALFVGLSLFSLFTYQKYRGVMGWKAPLKALQSYAWDVRVANVEPVYFLVVWLLTINIAPLIISVAVQPIYQNLYTIAASLALYLLVAKGIRNINHRYAKVAVIGLVVALMAVPVHTSYTTVIKPQAREATSFIDTNAKSGDVVLISPIGHSLVFAHYNNRTDVAVRPIHYWNVPSSGAHAQDKTQEVQSYVNGSDRVWFFDASYEGATEADSFTLQILNKSYENEAVQTYKDYVVYVFEKRA
ncbi:MAG: glycosyltransferase family 39 protein [Halobacteriota archaeon]